MIKKNKMSSLFWPCSNWTWSHGYGSLPQLFWHRVYRSKH